MQRPSDLKQQDSRPSDGLLTKATFNNNAVGAKVYADDDPFADFVQNNQPDLIQ